MAQILDEGAPAGRRRHAAAPTSVRRRHRKQPASTGPRWAYWLVAALVFAVPVLALGGLLGLSGVSTRAARLDLGLLDSTVGQLPQSRQLAADSMVLDRSGNSIADLHPAGDSRLPVPLAGISPWLQKATVDVEDRNFYHEGAVDPKRILAAAWNDLVRDGPIQGASTITQQLAKIQYLNDAPTVARKLREIFVAQHIESTMSKQQILEAYVNDIPYGHGATGIQAAAHIYFNVDASKLDLAQSALLAGLPDAPSELDPLLHADAAKHRQMLVLQSMIQAGEVTAAQAADAYAAPLNYANGNASNLNTQPAFVARVRQAVSDQVKVNPDEAGLTITTTLDPGLQDLAQQAIVKQVQALKANRVTNGAVVTTDPTTGDVLAYIGSAGPNVPGGQIDMAAVPRQPGSTFKLFTYSTAISQHKVTMLTPVLDAPFSLKTGGGPNGVSAYNVIDYDQRYHGLMPLEMALGNSLNVPAVKVEMYTGISNIVNTARAMGVTTLDAAPESYTPSLTLGAYPVPLWQMAQAATAFANQGKLQPLRFVTSVKGSDGRELLSSSASQQRQVLDPGTVFIMNQILSNDANRVLEFGPRSALTIPDHLVSAKTGTTNDFRDNLTIGWTPKLVTAAWVGNADNSPMQGTTGVTGAAPIWNQVMSQALTGKADDWPQPSSGIQTTQFQGHQGYLLDGTKVAWIPDLTGGINSYATPSPSASVSPTPSGSPTPSASSSSSASPSPSNSAPPSPSPAAQAFSPPSASSPAPSPAPASPAPKPNGPSPKP